MRYSFNYFRTKTLLLILIAFLGFELLMPDESFSDEPTNRVASVDFNPTNMVWGTETNGVRIGISVDPKVQGVITVHLRINPELKIKSIAQTNYIRGTHFKATNFFAGPIELRDMAGQKPPLLKPEINSSNAYPATFSLSAVRFAYMSQYSIYSGPPLPPTSVGNGPLPPFRLTDYFKLEKPGKYLFTLWPKVYERIDADICRRIDIPPITVTIEWKGKPK